MRAQCLGHDRVHELRHVPAEDRHLAHQRRRDKGELLLDQKPLTAYTLESLRRNIGVVLQDVFLFSGSILDNITLRNPAISEADVIKARYGLTDGQPKTLDEIGKVHGVTRERIRQIESKTMSKLRHPSRSQSLRDYLD